MVKTKAKKVQIETETRVVKVPSGRSFREAIVATKRVPNYDEDLLESVLRSCAYNGDVIFYRPKRWIEGDNDLRRELSKHNLVLADPHTQAQVHIDDPNFADDHPNFTHWKGPDGKWYFAKYWLRDNKRVVEVCRRRGDIGKGWWFACFKKPIGA